MMEKANSETLHFLDEFLERLLEDRDRGTILELEEYQALFPGFEDAIAEEYRTVVESRSEGAGVVDAPPALRRLGPYRVLRELGHGGQGVVYLAVDEELERQVALKVLSSRLSLSGKVLARFKREAQVASRLQHPGICTVFDAGEEDGMAYIAMQFVEGESLARMIERARREGLRQVLIGSSTAGEEPSEQSSSSRTRSQVMALVRLMEAAARAVHEVHKVGIIHRDLKPGNILVNSRGEPVVLDFGLAQEEEERGEALTLSSDLLGTPAYLPPERVRGNSAKADASTDVYGLGVALYECLTLQRPFSAPTRDGLYRKILSEEASDPRRLNPQIPRDLAVVLKTALDKDVNRRYQSALDLAEDLRRVRCYEPIAAKPMGTLMRLRRWTQRNPKVAALLALLFVALVTTAFFLRSSRISLRHSRALGLVGASLAAMENDEVLALQLAREAFALEEIPETRTQLHAALFQLHELREFPDTVWPFMPPAFSPSGDAVLVNCRDMVTRLWDREWRVKRTFASSFWHCGFFLDGERFFTTSATENNGHEVLLWRIESSWQAREIGKGMHHNHDYPEPGGTVIHQVAVSPSGQLICTCGQKDHLSRLWKVEGEEITLVHELESGEDPPGLAVFSPDGKSILTAEGWCLTWQSDIDSSPRLWDVETGQVRKVLEGHKLQVLSAVFSPDGNRILTASKDRTARIWKLNAGDNEPPRVLNGHENWVTSAVFSSNGETTLTASLDGTARLWTKEGKQQSILHGHKGALLGAIFSPDPEERWILTWSIDKTIRLWRRDGCPEAVFRGHNSQVAQARFVPCASPERPQVLSLALDYSMKLWSLDDEVLPVFRGHRGYVSGAEFLPGDDGKWSIVVTASHDGTLRFWDVESGVEFGERMQNFTDPIWHLRVSRIGDRILVASGPLAKLYRWRQGEIEHLKDLGPCMGSVVDAIAFSQQGDRAVFGSDWTGKMIVWKEGIGHEVYEGIVSPNALAISPDGEKLFFSGATTDGSDAGKLALRDWSSRTVEEDLIGKLDQSRLGSISACAFSPDGLEFTVGSDDGFLVFFRMDGMVSLKLRTISGHDARVTSISYSKAGNHIVTASMDNTARLWTQEGELIMSFKGHTGTVHSARFSDDGSRVLTASGDGTARMWFTDPEELRKRVNERLEGYEIPEEIRQRYADLLPAGR